VISTEAITACAALAFAPRLALYWLRVRRGPEDFTPSELTRRLRMPAQTLSPQFKALWLAGVRTHWRGIGVTPFINWAIKPFSMALLGWVLLAHLFRPGLPAREIDRAIGRLILLAAAPCTAMVFVWSCLAGGELNFALTQVALKDTLMVFAFAPIVALLFGVAAINVPRRSCRRSRRSSWCRCCWHRGCAARGSLTPGPKGSSAGSRAVIRSPAAPCSPRWCCCSAFRADASSPSRS
jgi:hypothetical protein